VAGEITGQSEARVIAAQAATDPRYGNRGAFFRPLAPA
jgi:hypothetical protein